MVSSRGNLGHLTLSQHLARASKIMAGAGTPGFIPGSKAAFL